MSLQGSLLKLGVPGACKGCPPLLQGGFATRYRCLITRMRLQRLALMWQVRLYVHPYRPCMTMVCQLTVARDCRVGRALTAAALVDPNTFARLTSWAQGQLPGGLSAPLTPAQPVAQPLPQAPQPAIALPPPDPVPLSQPSVASQTARGSRAPGPACGPPGKRVSRKAASATAAGQIITGMSGFLVPWSGLRRPKRPQRMPRAATRVPIYRMWRPPMPSTRNWELFLSEMSMAMSW